MSLVYLLQARSGEVSPPGTWFLEPEQGSMSKLMQALSDDQLRPPSRARSW